MPKSTLELAKSHLTPFFNACGRRVWTLPQIEKVLSDMREEWELAERIGANEFVEFLLKETSFVQTILGFPHELITRFWWGTPTIYEVAASVRSTGYFSHHSAMHLHNLINEQPSIVYINSEQQAKGARPGSLRQEGIDGAFKRPVRVSNNRAEYEDREICLLNGKNTGQFSVINRKHPLHGAIRMTSLARTLIDIVVRPAYSGGLKEVLGAYNKASGVVSVDDIINVLQSLQHAYPYHQSIGFLLEKSGCFDEIALKPFRDMGVEYDFYLDYQMKEVSYSKAWRLYYPDWMDDEQTKTQ